MEHHAEEGGDTAQGRRKGMPPLTSIPYSLQSNQGYSTLPNRKSRQSTRTLRDVSVSTAMSMLHIDEEPSKSQPKEHQAISSKTKMRSTPGSCHKASISTGLRNLRIDSTESALMLFQAPGDSLVAPRTPSQIPVLSKSEAVTVPVTPRTPRTPKILPPKPNFLSKDSNITAFTAWDVESRVELMESMYEELTGKVGGTMVERHVLEEALGLYKARSKVLIWCQKYVLM